jgi:hypothetical protein
MFGFGKKIEQDPKKALENADKSLNTGLTGALTKGFMGKDFVDRMNSSIEKGKNAMAGMEEAQMLAQSGMPASAEVLSIADTGMLVNFNPVVQLKLNVQPSVGGAFETTGQCAVSKIAIPRVGDKINIKYNPADPSKIVVM